MSSMFAGESGGVACAPGEDTESSDQNESNGNERRSAGHDGRDSIAPPAWPRGDCGSSRTGVTSGHSRLRAIWLSINELADGSTIAISGYGVHRAGHRVSRGRVHAPVSRDCVAHLGAAFPESKDAPVPHAVVSSNVEALDAVTYFHGTVQKEGHDDRARPSAGSAAHSRRARTRRVARGANPAAARSHARKNRRHPKPKSAGSVRTLAERGDEHELFSGR